MSGMYKGYTVDELCEAVLWELGQVTGTTAIYTRFSKAQIRKKLTKRQNEFVYASHCLKKYALIPCVSGIRQYRLPTNCMDGGLISAKFYATSTAYEELEIKDYDYMNTAGEGYLTDSDSQPDMCFQGASYGQQQTLEIYPGPDTTGTDYATGDDTGVTIGESLPQMSDNIAGTATGGGATTCIDTGVTVTDLGLYAGMYIRNVTDSSYAAMVSFDTNTITHATLTGGTANVFAADDDYLIMAGEYITLVRATQQDDYLFGYQMGILSNITVPAYNLLIEYVPYPIEFPASGIDDYLYPEIPKRFHEDLAMAVVGDFLKSFHEKTKEFQRAQYYEGIWQKAIAEGKSMKESRPFKNKPVQMRPA